MRTTSADVYVSRPPGRMVAIPLVETSVVALDPNTHMALLDKLHKGHAEFSCHERGKRARVLLVTQKNVKVRSRHSSIMQSAQTLYKQGYDLPRQHRPALRPRPCAAGAAHVQP